MSEIRSIRHAIHADPQTPGLVVVGWVVVAQDADAPACRLAERARTALLARLQRLLPEFVWEMPLVLQRREPGAQAADAPPDLIRRGEAERDAGHWDFALVVGDRDLEGRTRDAPLAAVSRAFFGAAISAPTLEATGRTDEDALSQLGLNLLGRLVNLPLEDEPHGMMADLQDRSALGRLAEPDAEEMEAFRAALGRIADARIEERPEQPHSRLAFRAAALAANRTELLQTLRRAEPWSLPLRLGKVTAAALSALLVLSLTAEAWELALAQNGWVLAGLTCVALGAASAFVAARHRLLDRPDARMDSEQRVVANAAIVLILLAGMLTTYLLLVATSLGLSAALFADSLVASWAGREAEGVGFGAYLKMAGLIGLIGLAVGALGAGFESRGYLRHVAFVDEEI